MTCPHCNKVIIVKLMKDTGSKPAEAKESADTSDLGELLDMIEDGALEGKSVDFIAQTRERFEKYKGSTRMSPAQMKWVRELATGIKDEEF